MIRPIHAAELMRRVSRAGRGLSSCQVCERRCGANRRAGQAGFCGLGAESRCYRRHVSFGEEPQLLPSYLIYLSGCNLRCTFCGQAPASRRPQVGSAIDLGELAAKCTALVAGGVRTINLVGGEPSLHVHTILALAARADEPLPLVLNSNMYMTPQTLELLGGVVSTYVADFKFGNDTCAERLAAVSPYVRIVMRNLALAARQGDVIVRHLMLPGHVDCCLMPVARWLAENLPRASLHVMTSYVPPAGGQPAGCVSADEVAEARRRLGRLSGGGTITIDGRLPDGPQIAAGAGPTELDVTIGADGRVYFHDLPAEMLPVAAELAGGRPSAVECSGAASTRQEGES